MVQRLVAFALLAGLAACSSPPAKTPAAAAAPESTAATVTQLVGRAGAGALVTLEPMDAAVPVPQGAAVMDQFSKAFVPETLFVRVGQPVTFKNSEDQLHNVTVLRSRSGAAVFNISQNQGDVHSHTFEAPGEYDVNCDVHPGMRATIVATTTPYAVYSDARGSFAFASLTPGRYRLRVSADGRDTERVIDVTGAQMDVGEIRAR